ncbi:L,D-transpeptidase [Mesorhizobium ephedrae]|uniref:L,D-transpeptidase n=2 Tax=Kumtagia ephedrae TaxID=2116701 RepID=A0A2P7RXJ7_9HYPH|nr:L,D-transpeptidase [Mesorhizobium ephedrae]
MLPRSLLLLGLCAALGMATPALAEPAKPQKSTVVQAKKKTAEARTSAKKKVVARKKAGQTEEEKALAAQEKAKARQEALEKQRQAKLAAMRAKAKADADARRTAFLGSKETARGAAAKEKPGKKGKAAEVAVAEQPKRSTFRILFGDERKPEPEQSQPVALRSAKPVTGLTAERIAAQKAAAVGAETVVRSGNNGELRSGEVGNPQSGFFQVLFGDEPAGTNLLPETRALDSVLEQKQQTKGRFKLRPEYEAQTVAFSGYPRGTIVVDTANHFLYLVESAGTARRYGIAVGREGLQYKGRVTVGDKQEWPRWIPTKEMQQREPRKYGQYKDGMPGGGQNPLGARAIYLYSGKQDTYLRIHGTIAPQSIGTNASNGCFRMTNEHVIDLYNRVRPGTPVVVL